ncbi:MAG: nucleoside-diphosphate sugar epimerase/dehydratase [bacterium]
MTTSNSMLDKKCRSRLILFMAVDSILVTLAYLTSYLLRFDMKFPFYQYLNFRNTLIPILVLKISSFYYYNLYLSVYQYTSLKDLEAIIKACLTGSFMVFLFIFITHRFQGFARSVFLIDSILTLVLIGGFRLGIRIVSIQKRQRLFRLEKNKLDDYKRKKVLIIGAGDAGEKILREIHGNVSLRYEVVGFLDEGYDKINKYIHGVKVMGNINCLPSLAKNIHLDEIIIAIPSASAENMRSMVDIVQKSGITCKTIPSLGELINGKVSLSNIREISYSDLLGRTQVELDIDKIGAYLGGKSVLITGAGGSIGSECCRQVARFKPKIIIMLDRAESNLYDIEMEVNRLFPRQDIVPVLGSITCLAHLRKIFFRYRPQVIFHAAAYKHVPMMEIHPWEAVYNNILGTKYVCEAAVEFGAERFVSISTDKAVRPTNVMGASKKVAEIILQLKSQEIKNTYPQKRPVQTRIMAVRFGNVIGSAGSVIPLFKKQIAHGGPVTVTHPDVTRYFMTINEAVQLVLQAGAMGESGEIYILKMGKAVKIIDMARDLIRLSCSDKDIRIEITGLRPGEKLYEELITDEEGIVSTPHEKLMVLKNNSSDGICYHDLEKKINELLRLADRNDSIGIRAKLKEIVPEYNPQAPRKNPDQVCEKIGEVEQKSSELVVNFN